MENQSRFSRVAAGDVKMEYYPTDPAHCDSISEMLVISDEEQTAVIEPCAGLGDCVLRVTNAKPNIEQVRIFACELNNQFAEDLAQQGWYESVVCADYLAGTVIQKNAFGLAVANPPYATDEDGERLEYKFLVRLTDQMVKGGVVVWIVPYAQFIDPKMFRCIMTNYELLCVYRFRPSEYQKFHQVVAILRKKDKRLLLRSDLDEKLAPFLVEDAIAVLPEHPTERIEVPTSQKDVEKIAFTAKEFDWSNAYETLNRRVGTESFSDLTKVLDTKLTTSAFVHGQAGRPPIPPKKDTLYLMATSGYGAGLTGSIETHDRHLQRGVAEIVEDTVYEPGQKEGDEGVLRVTSRTKVTMTVVEPDGRITVLE